MRAPKCKTCQVEHWGVCYTPPAAIKAQIAKIPAKKPGKKTTKTKARKPNGAA